VNHDCARQIQDGPNAGRWYYTSGNNRSGTHAIGYCSPWENCPDCNPRDFPKSMGGPPCEKCNGTRLIMKAEPCPGHTTADEACAHQKKYLIDKATLMGPKTTTWPKQKCCVDGCDEEATHVWNVSAWSYFEVCNVHAVREILEALVCVGESWHS
jgi:hypothetical protein